MGLGMSSCVPGTLIAAICDVKKCLELCFPGTCIPENSIIFSHSSLLGTAIILRFDGTVSDAMLSLIVARHGYSNNKKKKKTPPTPPPPQKKKKKKKKKS